MINLYFIIYLKNVSDPHLCRVEAKIKERKGLFQNFKLLIYTGYTKCFQNAFDNIVIPKIVNNYKFLVVGMRLLK